MAYYEISQAFSADILRIAEMSSRFTSTDPLTNAMLRDSSGIAWNPVESRKLMALHNYNKGIRDYGLSPSSFVLKSCSHFALEASAWIQHFDPDSYWHVRWKDEPNTFDIPPHCVDEILYNKIEDALHTNRKTNMQGKEHYCSFTNSPILEKA